MIAGIGDLSGESPTFTRIKEEVGPTLNRAFHVNPDDNREKFLRLTTEGRAVLQRVMETLTETSGKAPARQLQHPRLRGPSRSVAHGCASAERQGRP